MKAQQPCMGTRAGKDRVCILYNDMMSIYPRVCQRYTSCCSVHLRYPCIFVPPRLLPPAKLNGGGENRSFPPQWPSHASESSLNWRLQVLLQLHSNTVCRQIHCMYIYRATLIIYAILRCSESGDCNKGEYDRQNSLWLRNPKNHCCENVASSCLQSCTEVSAAHKVSLRQAQRSRLHSKSPADLRRGLTCSKIWLFYKSNLVASRMPLHTCRCFQEHLRMLLHSLRVLCFTPGGPGEHLEVFWSAGEDERSVWEVCLWLPDWFTFCWWSS